MHIISGAAKGRALKIPKSRSVRPASQKVKEATFDILIANWASMEDLRILDLFAGSGSLGIEALSRGAKSATFVEGDPDVLALIGTNLKTCKFEGRGILQKLTLPWGLKRLKGPFDLIFLDPPYDKNLVNPSIRQIARQKILAEDGRLVVEHSPREKIDDPSLAGPVEEGPSAGLPPTLQVGFPAEGSPSSPPAGQLRLIDQRKYGQTLISFLTR